MRKDDAILSRTHHTSWVVLVLVGTLAGLLSFGPFELWAQKAEPPAAPSAPPLKADDVQSIHRTLTTHQVVGTVGRQLVDAIGGAVEATGCYLLETGLKPARQAFYNRRYERARTLALAYIRHARPNEDCPARPAAETKTDRSKPRNPKTHPSNEAIERTRARARLLAANAAPDRLRGRR